MTATLVTDAEYRAAITATREADVRKALARGLAEYLAGLGTTTPDGREIRFKRVLGYWAENETKAVYPSAVVYSLAPLLYGAGEDETGLTPGVTPEQRLPDGRFYSVPSECSVELTVEVWCTDEEERSAFIMLLEDAFDPVDWMHGFRLVLPHYHGAVAGYTARSNDLEDEEGELSRRYRKATFTVLARVAQVRVLGELKTGAVRVQVGPLPAG